MVRRKRRQLVPINHEVACRGRAVNPVCRMQSRICLNFESVCGCGGLTLAGGQVPTKAALSLPLLSWTGERKYNARLMGGDKDREITHQLLSRAKQAGLGGKKINYQSNQSRIMR